jgi:hypothetical protein
LTTSTALQNTGAAVGSRLSFINSRRQRQWNMNKGEKLGDKEEPKESGE